VTYVCQKFNKVMCIAVVKNFVLLSVEVCCRYVSLFIEHFQTETDVACFMLASCCRIVDTSLCVVCM